MELAQTDQKGNRLVSLTRSDEATVLERHDPVSHSLVVCLNHNASSVLIVEAKWRSEWELPGGTREEGETPRECALRELHEETGLSPDSLEWYGLLEWRLAPDNRTEYGCLYRCVSSEFERDMGTGEIGRVEFLDFSSGLARVSPLDVTLAQLVRTKQYLP